MLISVKRKAYKSIINSKSMEKNYLNYKFKESLSSKISKGIAIGGLSAILLLSATYAIKTIHEEKIIDKGIQKICETVSGYHH